MNSQRDIDLYSSNYLDDYGFESVMVTYRRKLLLERLHLHRPQVVLEIGCGTELLYEAWLKEGGLAECWLIVEPARQFCEVARASGLPNLHVVGEFFENAIDQVQNITPRQPDVVICSALLHEVLSPSGLLAASKYVMGPDTVLHVNVPNAGSIHRRLARSMGLIADTKAMSERNIALMQPRVYDRLSLRRDLEQAGMRVTEEGGYLVKPFTHAQMEQCVPILGWGVMDGLDSLGRELPELASEIFVEAVRADHG